MRPCLPLLVLMMTPSARVVGEVVRTEYGHVTTEGDHMRTEGDHTRTEGDHMRTEGDYVRTEGHSIRAEGDHVRVDSEGSSDPCSSSACERIDSRLVSRHHYRNIRNRDTAILLTTL